MRTWDSSAEGASFGDSGHRLPRPRRAFGGAELDDRYYLVGGLREGFQVVSDCDVFDWKTLAWARMASPSKSRISPELAALGGKLYLAGGTSPKEGGGFELNTSLECYEPSADRWTLLLERLPVGAAHVRVFPFRKKLLFASIGAEAEGLLRIGIFTPPHPLATAGLTDR